MKKLCQVLLFLTTCVSHAQVKLDSGLVSCFPLNGNGTDMISAFNATLTNLSPVQDRSATPGAALAFNCNTVSFAQIPAAPQLKPQQFSFSAWIKPSASFYSRSYILYTSSATNTNSAYSMSIEKVGSNRFLQATKRLPQGISTVMSTISLGSLSWYHVGFSFDNNKISLYLNGVLQTSIAAPGATPYSPTDFIYLGTSSTLSVSEAYCGNMDNVRFYDRALSAQEFSALAQTDPACLSATAAPVAAFTVNPPSCEGQPMQLLDLSLNSPTSYSWQVQGGILSNPQNGNPVLTFTSAGVYSATLYVSNALGTSSVVQTFTIHPRPMVVIVPNRTLTCYGLGANLTGLGAQTYTWNIAASGNSVFVNPASNTAYTVTGTDSLGCVGTGTLLIKVTTDCFMSLAEEDSNAMVSIGPNPASESLSVRVDGGNAWKLEILSGLGVCVKSFDVSSEETIIDLREFPAGLYILRLSVQNAQIERRLLRE